MLACQDLCDPGNRAAILRSVEAGFVQQCFLVIMKLCKW